MALYKPLKIFTVALIVFMAGFSPVRADEAAKQKLVIEMFKVLKYDRIADQVAAAVGKQIKAAIQKKNPAVGKKVLDVVSEVARETFAGLTPQLAEYTAGFMVRNFTAQELAALVAFYKTPAGQKSVTVIPKMTQEMMVWIGPVTRGLQADMLSRLKARLEELGYQL